MSINKEYYIHLYVYLCTWFVWTWT